MGQNVDGLGRVWLFYFVTFLFIVKILFAILAVVHIYLKRTGKEDSQMNEFIEEGMADVDFQIKVRAKQFFQVLRTLQEVRRGVRESRHKSGV